MTAQDNKFDAIHGIMNFLNTDQITNSLLTSHDIPSDSDVLFSDLKSQIDFLTFPASSLDFARIILSGLIRDDEQEDGSRDQGLHATDENGRPRVHA